MWIYVVSLTSNYGDIDRAYDSVSVGEAFINYSDAKKYASEHEQEGYETEINQVWLNK